MSKKNKGRGTSGGGIIALPGPGTLAPSAGASAGSIDANSILAGPGSAAEKKAALLQALGMKRPRQKYPNAAARKEAQKELAKIRRQKQNAALQPYGLAPAPRKRRTEAEKKQYRKDYAKKRRTAFKDIIKEDPALQQKLREQYGFKRMKFI